METSLTNLVSSVDIRTNIPLERYVGDYAINLARKRESALEFKKNFPSNIELDNQWSSLFDKIRNASVDGHEHWGFVGFVHNSQSLTFQMSNSVGEHLKISSQIMADELARTRQNLGPVDQMCDVHSHPRSYLDKINLRLEIALGLKELLVQPSVIDFFDIVNTERFVPMMAIVEGNSNLLVFRTRDTMQFKPGLDTKSQHRFNNYWLQNCPYSYVEKIAKKHSLVVYQGKRGDTLRKVF